jgi:predicted RND superfamily exporter protein
MAMKAISKTVTTHPKTVIIVVLIITGLLGAAYAQMGGEMEAEESTFLPDNELVNAYIEIGDNYTSTTSVQALVRANDGDILTQEALLDILRVEEALLNDEDINSTLTSPDNPSESVTSVADIIVLGNMTLEGKRQFLEMLSSLIPVLESLSFDEFNTLLDGINSSVISGLFVLESDASSIIKDNASTILLNEIELMNLAANLNMSDDGGSSSMEFIGNLTQILISSSDNMVKKNATHMVLSQIQLMELMGSTSGDGGEQLASLSALFDPLNSSLSDPALDYNEKKMAIQGTVNILTMQIEEYADSYLLFTSLDNLLSSANDHVNNGDNDTAAALINGTVGDPFSGGLTQNITYMNMLNDSLTSNISIISNFLYSPSPANATLTQANLSTLIPYLVIFGASSVELDALSTLNDTLTLYLLDPSNTTNMEISLEAGQQALALLGTHQASVSQGMLMMGDLVYGLESLRDDIILNASISTEIKVDAVGKFQAGIQENMTMINMINGFMENLRGTLIDLVYILGSSAPDDAKDSAISIMVGELTLFSAPSQSPPDPIILELMANIGETLGSHYTILSVETDQAIIDHSVNMVVSMFALMETPMGSGISETIPDFGGSMNGSGGMFSISTRIEDKIDHLENNMTGSSVKETLRSLFNYNASEDDELVGNASVAVNNAIMQLASVESSISGLLENLIWFEENLSDAGDKAIVSNFSWSISENLTLMSEASSGMQMLGYGLSAVSMMDGTLQGLAFSIPMMLTKDFDVSSAELKSEGTMVIIQLNAEALPGESEEAQSERFLALEKRITRIAEETDHPNTRINVLGMNMVSEEILDATMDSMNILLPAAFILVIVILALIYRNGLDMLFSLLALAFAIVWVYGSGTLLGFVFNPLTIAVPVLIVGLGIDYGIHMTLRYREEREEELGPQQAAGNTILSVGTALLLATATTVIGFLSNIVSEMSVLREFTILCAIGIIASFFIMVTFVPACKLIVDIRKSKKRKDTEEKKEDKNNNKKSTIWHTVKGGGVSAINKGLGFGATAAEHHPIPTIVIAIILAAGGMVSAMQLDTEFNLEDFLPKEMEISKTITYLSENFNISTDTSEILIKGDVAQTEVLFAINETVRNMGDDIYVQREYGRWGETAEVSTILTLMWNAAEDQTSTNPRDLYSQEFSDMFHGNDTNNDWIPDNNVQALLTWIYINESTMSSAKRVLHQNDDGQLDGTLISISVDTGDNKGSELYDELKEDITPLKALVEDETIDQVTITGMPILMDILLTELTNSMQHSLIITVILCFAMLTIVFFITKRSFALGGLATLPVLLCLAWILGTMFLMGIPYNVLTVSVTALTVGLGVTYGIHITHRFLEDLEHFDDIEEACRYSIQHTGSALFGAAATTIAGFGLLVFALLPPLQQFGAVIALTILYSFLASVFVLPALLVMWAKWRNNYRKKRGIKNNAYESEGKEEKIESDEMEEEPEGEQEREGKEKEE